MLTCLNDSEVWQLTKIISALSVTPRTRVLCRKEVLLLPRHLAMAKRAASAQLWPHDLPHLRCHVCSQRYSRSQCSTIHSTIVFEQSFQEIGQVTV